MSQTGKSGLLRAVEQDASLFTAIPLDCVPNDVSLPYAIYVRVADQFILFRPQDDKLTAQRAENLAQMGVNVVYLHRTAWPLFLRWIDEMAEGTPAKDLEDSVTNVRHQLIAYGRQLEDTKDLQRKELKKLHNLGQQLAIGIKRRPELSAKLLRRYSDPSMYFVNHTVNVATYSAAIGHKLGLPLPQVQMLTFSALVHNIGKLFVPREILYKPGSLTKQEWNIICEHPQRGASLLEDLSAPKEVILTAMQHHERIDGAGYPHHTGGNEIHLYARLCSIADVYDAMTNISPYQKSLTPTQAVEKMVGMQGKFDPQILKMMTKV